MIIIADHENLFSNDIETFFSLCVITSMNWITIALNSVSVQGAQSLDSFYLPIISIVWIYPIYFYTNKYSWSRNQPMRWFSEASKQMYDMRWDFNWIARWHRKNLWDYLMDYWTTATEISFSLIVQMQFECFNFKYFLCNFATTLGK